MSLVESIALRAPIYLEVLNARYDYFQINLKFNYFLISNRLYQLKLL